MSRFGEEMFESEKRIKVSGGVIHCMTAVD